LPGRDGLPQLLSRFKPFSETDAEQLRLRFYFPLNQKRLPAPQPVKTGLRFALEAVNRRVLAKVLAIRAIRARTSGVLN